MTTSIQKIRPAARLLQTIGQDLIKDVYAAIVELVKNAYDADSPNAKIHFAYRAKQSLLLIRVEDSGHGMSPDIVTNNWLVPATDDKLRRIRSKNDRVMQGRKGIGRFAAAVLGERILLETTQAGTTTSLILDMDQLDDIEFLDQLELEVSVEKTGKKDGTVIEIEKENVSAEDVETIWTKKQINKLLIELRSLLSPEDVYKAASSRGYKIHYDEFKIILSFKEFPVVSYANRELEISPFPVLDLYDYRISGIVDKNGKAKLRYENQNVSGLPEQEFRINITFDEDDSMQSPGEVFIDLRAYDRDPESIDNIIKRGLKDPDTGEYVGKRDARHILNESYGVGIYREQFRIRPYGDQAFDWLGLDKKRVQKPAYKIGHDQIIGFVYIHSEENSGLVEKSARDGLKENNFYAGLIHAVSLFVNELEVRRVKYREKTQKGGRNRPIDEEINQLFDFDTVTRRITRELDDRGMPRQDRETVGVVVSEALETEKQKKSTVARRIRDTIATYQNQATLGKITHVLLHEGRKHIKYIAETVPRIVKWAKQLSEGSATDLVQKLDDRSVKVVSHTKGLSHLFKKIEPLARTRRSPAKAHTLRSVVESSFEVFSSELHELGISYELHTDAPNAKVVANEMDLITIFANLIENSVYWLRHKKRGSREIEVQVDTTGKELIVQYLDNGPGFQGGNLELMFEPGFTMKPDGTGLGLALAGEAVGRIGGTIEANRSESGAVFTIVFEENK